MPPQALLQQIASAQWPLLQSVGVAQLWPSRDLHMPLGLAQVCPETHDGDPQHVPLTQFPVAHSVPNAQLWPLAFRHVPVAQTWPALHEVPSG